MMTRDETTTLSDADLVRLVAERVMGWEWRMYSPTYAAIMEDEGAREPPWERQEIGKLITPMTKNGNPWKPLTDWNHTIQVMEAMRAKGYMFAMYCTDDVEIQFIFNKIDDGRSTQPIGDERRAILQAALIAVEATT